MANLLTAIRHTTHNRAEIEASTVCGCCNCMQTFAPDEIIAWSGLDAGNFDDPEALTGGTAMCPRCGGEAVVGDKSGCKIDMAFLSGMNEAWFQRTMIIRKPAPKA